MTPRKILFATVPVDGHFNPLTSLAVHLKKQGHDVRWYTQEFYREKLKKLDIYHYHFVEADQFNQENLDEVFSGRTTINNMIAKLNFDLQEVFIKQGPLYYKDIQRINRHFNFDLLIADNVFTGVPYVKKLMQKPVFTVGVLPLSEMSKDLAPTGLAMTPATTFIGRIRQHALRFVAKNILFRKSDRVSKATLAKYGIETNHFLFDEMARRSNLLLQSGVPGFEYERSDMSRNVRFIGALLPYSSTTASNFKMPSNKRYDRVILVTQGTVEKNVDKIIVPVLEAFRNTNTLVIATTGGSGTKELRSRYPDDNFIIEDFIPFSAVLPYCSVYITNGGYGGVTLGIQHKVPMIVAGVHEGKNEICARVGYFRIGINLKTERPTSLQIIRSVNKISADATYKQNIVRLANEFSSYNPTELLDGYIAELFNEKPRVKKYSQRTFATGVPVIVAAVVLLLENVPDQGFLC